MTDRLPAITLYQPWASLWLTTRKVHETRAWPTKYRGPLVVHAGKRDPRMQQYSTMLYEVCSGEFGHKWMDELPRGVLLGVVDLIDCAPTSVQRPVDHTDFVCGNWDGGRYAWRRRGFRLLPKPIPYRGLQGVFYLQGEVFKAINATEVA